MADTWNYLALLDQCVVNHASLGGLIKIIERIRKCCHAIKNNLNLADICNDPANHAALVQTFGEKEMNVGFQILVRLALEEYTCRSFSLNSAIQDQKKLLFIHQQVAGWRQFDSVITFQIPSADVSESFFMINPEKLLHWKKIKELPVGTLVSVYIKMKGKSRSGSQENIATEKFFAIFDMIQNRPNLDVGANPVVQLKYSQEKRPKPAIRQSTAPKWGSAAQSQQVGGSTPVAATRVVVNKIDVFVHAGNAQLIVTHCKDYAGRVEMFVVRDKKQKIQLDADSIWSAEVRNGETVLFEFFGPQPADEFLKELARKVNKYTQMDKMA